MWNMFQVNNKDNILGYGVYHVKSSQDILKKNAVHPPPEKLKTVENWDLSISVNMWLLKLLNHLWKLGLVDMPSISVFLPQRENITFNFSFTSNAMGIQRKIFCQHDEKLWKFWFFIAHTIGLRWKIISRTIEKVLEFETFISHAMADKKLCVLTLARRIPSNTSCISTKKNHD